MSQMAFANFKIMEEEMSIYYGYYDSPIGLIEIKTNDEKLIALDFVAEMKETLGSVEILNKTIKQLDEYFNGERKQFDIPYELNGTEFQKKSWDALTKIPYAQTWSYENQAIYIGNIKATRAVGNANSKNPIGIIVPCHRVIGKNNKLTGYAGGLDKKEWLLNHEKRISQIK